jgi:hypothetical protein
MTNTQRYAQRELDILVKSASVDDRPIIEEFIPEILALCEKFGKSGQSGGSAPYTATALSHAIKKLCLQESICPITGIEDEWIMWLYMGMAQMPATTFFIKIPDAADYSRTEKGDVGIWMPLFGRQILKVNQGTIGIPLLGKWKIGAAGSMSSPSHSLLRPFTST